MKAKLTAILIVASIITISLTACSSASIATVSSSNSLSTESKLALGTLKLEGTSQAVTSAQATELLTLWQGYQSLSNSDTSSPVELEALVKQIQGTMTTDQMKAIEAMGLTDQSVSDVALSLGSSASASTPASTPNASAISQAAPASGPGGPSGMAGGSGDSVMSAIGIGMAAQSTLIATQASTASNAPQINPMLLQALIQLLEMRSQTTG